MAHVVIASDSNFTYDYYDVELKESDESSSTNGQGKYRWVRIRLTSVYHRLCHTHLVGPPPSYLSF